MAFFLLLIWVLAFRQLSLNHLLSRWKKCLLSFPSHSLCLSGFYLFTIIFIHGTSGDNVTYVFSWWQFKISSINPLKTQLFLLHTIEQIWETDFWVMSGFFIYNKFFQSFLLKKSLYWFSSSSISIKTLCLCIWQPFTYLEVFYPVIASFKDTVEINEKLMSPMDIKGGTEGALPWGPLRLRFCCTNSCNKEGFTGLQKNGKNSRKKESGGHFRGRQEQLWHWFWKHKERQI